MSPAPVPMTLDEYLRTPETLEPQELAYGVLKVADAPLPRHQQAVFAFARALNAHVREHDLGQVWISPLDVILDEHRALVVQPDLLYISHQRAHIVRDRVRGAPDLVVEVLSPRPRIGDFGQRLGWFARYGVRECWVYRQTQRTLEILTLTANGVMATITFGEQEPLRSAVLPRFTLSTRDIIE
jgi:Uma2 family endonuclease